MYLYVQSSLTLTFDLKIIVVLYVQSSLTLFFDLKIVAFLCTLR